MKIISLVGPLGSGKTTLTLNIFKVLQDLGIQTQEICAYLVNDEGAFIDGELARERAQVVAMTNGCFTCSDTADLKKNLELLEKSGIEYVFLEGFGVTSGNETREFLEEQPWPFHIICTLSYKHFERDLVRYSDVVKSQVAAATVAIAVTKYPDTAASLMDLDEEEIISFIGKQNTGLPVVLVPDTSEVPTLLTDIFLEEQDASFTSISKKKSSCGCSHHNHDAHDHHHHHDFAFYPYSFALLDTVSFDQVKDCLAGKDFLLRIKGAVNGYLFNEVHGDWKQSTADTRQFLTFYSTRTLVFEKDLPGLLGVIKVSEINTEDPSYLQLRKEGGISPADTVLEIKLLLSELPTEPVIVSSGNYIRVLTHPEIMQTLKDGIARRQSVKDEWFPRVLKACMTYWLKCARLIEQRKQEILPDDLGKNLRELSVSLVWWVNRYPAEFGKEIVDATRAVRPGLMAVEGINMMDSLNSDPERAGWQHSELSESLAYGLDNAEDPELILKAIQHCISLTETPEMKSAWNEELEKLQTSKT